MDLNQIVQAFASKITTAIPDLQGDGYPMTPPAQLGFEIDFPPDGLAFNATAGNKTNDFQAIVRVMAATDVDSAVKRLYGLISDGNQSIAAVLNADKTLGGKVDDLFVRSASLPLRVVIDNTLYLAGEWRVDLTVSPS